MRSLLFLAIVLLASGAAPAAAVEALSVRAGSEPETVFRWAGERCDDLWIPDSPARAYRRADNSVVLIAAHYTNGVLEGRDFGSLRPNCAVAAKGKEDPDPAAFDDRFWVQALLPGGDGRVLGVVSHEYMGSRHQGRCEAPDRPGGNRCWYSSLLMAEADERAFRFRLLDGPGRFVAAPSARFDTRTERRVGFFTASNAVRSGDWHYLLAWVEQPGAFGNCLFRAPAADPASGWTVLRDGGFGEGFPNPYAAGGADRGDRRSCDVVGRGSLRNILRSVVWLERAGRWAGVYMMPAGHGVPEGVHYATSPDLVHWDAPRLLFGTESEADAKGCKVVYQYPSLIDHGSASPVFDTAGDDLHLYLTRFNRVSCQRGLDRDLVRVRVETRP